MFVAKPFVFWHSIANSEQAIATNPPPTYFQEKFIPNPCKLFPERVVELPHLQLLSAEMQDRIAEVISDELGEDPDEALELYEAELSVCPGTKIGGGVHWVQEPAYPMCKCGKQMAHLLTLASQEFDRDNYRRWCPTDLRDPWSLDSDERRAVQLAAFPRLDGRQR
jgi:hypothetical protein